MTTGKRLEGRVACITGGGSGIGRAMAQVFAREGAAVAVTDLDGAAADETLSGLDGSGHLALAGDVTDSARVTEVVAEIGKRCGRLDVLVNNAGVDRTPGDGFEAALAAGESPLLHMSDDGWSRMLDIHLNGALYYAREAARIMIPAGSGSILNVSSIAGLSGLGTIHYATAKAGLLGFTRSLARMVGGSGIRVNAICPGVIDTPMTQSIPKPLLKPLLGSTPLGRMGTAEDIANAALFLASDESSFLTGQWISPNGGLVMA